MARLMSFPPEILDRLFFYADSTTRKNLRCSSHVLSAIGQRWVFDCLTVSLTDASCDRLDHIISRPVLAKCVTKLYMNTWNLDDKVSDWDYLQEFQYQENGRSRTSLGERLWNAFDRLKELPRLESLILRFHDDCGETEFDNCLQGLAVRDVILTRFLSAVVALPRPLRELGLLDFQNVYFNETQTAANRNKVLNSLQILRLDVTNVDREESQFVHDCYRKLPRSWLKPTMANLEHLTLYSRLRAGFCPKLDLRGLHFPRLRSLSLGNYAFMHDSQLEWILSHGPTLLELYLDQCTIIYEAALSFNVDEPIPVSATILSLEDFHPHPDLVVDRLYASYSGRWADYFRAFENALPHLRHFRFGFTPGRWTRRILPFEQDTQIAIGFHQQCYMVFCDKTLWPVYLRKMKWRYDSGGHERRKDEKPLMPSNEDRSALLELCAKVGQSLKLHEGEFLNPE
ncbi:uncharacterized protein BDV14DRAFT_204058 [Aspergillus stella-maris]|uniref:uncharacterized protein n=1 Tax=Aspergillus stella-maris TaxID=1810926 RepID=UPI003CCCAD95